jgi:hypothetical protein
MNLVEQNIKNENKFTYLHIKETSENFTFAPHIYAP